LPYVLKAVSVSVGVFALLTGYALWEMVAGPRHLTGAVIPAGDLQAFRANILGTVIPTSNQLGVPHFLSGIADNFVDRNLSENGTFIGIPLLIVLAVILRRLWRDERIKAFFWLAVAAFVISLGSALNLGTFNTHIPLPEIVFKWLPLLNNTIPARFSLYVILFLSMILAIGLDRLWLAPGNATDRPRLSPRWRKYLGSRLGADTVGAKRARVGLAVAATAFSLLPCAPFLQRHTPWPRGLERSIEQLIPTGTVVVTYPYATPQHPAAMVWQAKDDMRFTLVGGYANIVRDGKDGRWPATLYPQYPQDLLAFSTIGDQYPRPPRPKAIDYKHMRTFLTKYHIGAVIWWDGADNPHRSFKYIRSSIGKPTVTGHNWAIWLPINGKWYAPGHRPAS
ncbi:MAG TPA: hypothetical protein VGP46_08135, partial [Acidimicrobiales bacterium]|nr:hypothetical protein [Acidimicrobiales bacterium]